MVRTEMPPVRDCEGHVVWRVRVAPGEKTCLACGEVAINNRCVRCSLTDDGQVADATPLMPTVSYLREGEWTQ